MPRQFTPHRLHDASGIVRRATPVADVVNSWSSGMPSHPQAQTRYVTLFYLSFGLGLDHMSRAAP